MYKKNNNQISNLGFSLIEISLVLAIIGFLVAGIMQGKNLLEIAKTKALKKQYDEIKSTIYLYQDKFNALPGDDLAADLHLGQPVAASKTLLNNGKINGAWNSVNPTEESYLVWQHLAAANLIKNIETNHAFGGRVGITSDVYKIKTNAICFSGIKGDIAIGLETKFDKLDTPSPINEGRIQAAIESGKYNTDEYYDICFEI